MRKVPTRSRRCYEDDTLFVASDSYLSVLIEQTDGWLRQDFCQKCAERMKPQGHFWKGVVPAKEEPSFQEDGSLLGKFKVLYAREAKSPLAYLFALYLERRGLLVRAAKGMFEEPHSGEVFQLKPAEIQIETAQKLSDVLDLHACSSA